MAEGFGHAVVFDDVGTWVAVGVAGFVDDHSVGEGGLPLLLEGECS